MQTPTSSPASRAPESPVSKGSVPLLSSSMRKNAAVHPPPLPKDHRALKLRLEIAERKLNEVHDHQRRQDIELVNIRRELKQQSNYLHDRAVVLRKILLSLETKELTPEEEKSIMEKLASSRFTANEASLPPSPPAPVHLTPPPVMIDQAPPSSPMDPLPSDMQNLELQSSPEHPIA